jgi:hypothetical protein
MAKMTATNQRRAKGAAAYKKMLTPAKKKSKAKAAAAIKSMKG